MIACLSSLFTFVLDMSHPIADMSFMADALDFAKMAVASDYRHDATARPDIISTLRRVAGACSSSRRAWGCRIGEVRQRTAKGCEIIV